MRAHARAIERDRFASAREARDEPARARLTVCSLFRRRLKFLNLGDNKLAITILACTILHNFVETHEPGDHEAEHRDGDAVHYQGRGTAARENQEEPDEDLRDPAYPRDPNPPAASPDSLEEGKAMRAQIKDYLVGVHRRITNQRATDWWRAQGF